MTVNVVFHGGLKKALRPQDRKTHKVHFNTYREILSWSEQLIPLREYMNKRSVEVRIGGNLTESRSLMADQVARWKIPNGATIHILPHAKGHEITTAMLVTALVSAAISIGVSLLANLLFPTSTGKTDTRKNHLYENGLQTNKEGVPLPYLAGDTVFAGGNVIEGDYDYTASGGSSLYAGLNSNATSAAALAGIAKFGGFSAAIQTDASQVQSGVTSFKKSGGKTISNTAFSDATIRFAMATGAGEIGGIKGSNGLEKSKNIYVNQVRLVDPVSGQPNYHGISWEERYGIEGQDPLKLTPGTSEPFSAGIDLTYSSTPGGSTHLTIPKTVSGPNINRVKLDFRINQLVQTDKKGNQSKTSVVFGADVKRANGSWTNAGSWQVYEKSSQAFDRQYTITAPDGAASDIDPWQFRVYRLTPDSTDDKLANSTTFEGWVEIIDKEYKYDGTETEGAVPTALFAAAIDMSSFNITDKPEVALILEGQKVRVPANYDPVAKTYNGTWNGDWNYAVTSNPVWHWLEIATNKSMGCGFPDDFFDKPDLYATAQRCDETINGRFRYTLNKQFTDQQAGWEALTDLAQTFRAFPYYNGTHVVLCQDRPGSPDHFINNAHIQDGKFSYSSTPGEQQYNQVIVQWDNPDDYYRVASVKYQDDANIAIMRAQGISNNGIISKTVYKTGCTNRQEAYDYAKALCWSAVNENRMVSFNTTISACAYAPGQRILVDDWNVTGKQWTGRIKSVGNGTVQLDQEVSLYSGQSYDALMVSDNVMARRAVSSDQSKTVVTDTISVDNTNIDPDTPISLVSNAGNAIQPTEWRISDIQETDSGVFQVTASRHIEGKFAFVDNNTPVTFTPWSQVQAVTPTPTGMIFKSYPYIDNVLGSSLGIDINWDKINSDPTGTNQGMALAGYTLEIQPPGSSTWTQVYKGTDNFCSIQPCIPGLYSFSLRSISILGKSSPALVDTWTLASDGSSGVLPPVFENFS